MHIILKNPDASVAVVHLSPEALLAVKQAQGYAELASRRAEVALRRAESEAAAIELGRRITFLTEEADAACKGLPHDQGYEQRRAAVVAKLKENLNGPVRLLEQRQAQLRAALEDEERIRLHDSVKANIGLTAEEHVALLKKRAPVGHEIHNQEIAAIDAALPVDRHFRAAWAWLTSEPVVEVHMGRAREIHRDNLRRMRAKEFEKNDLELRDAIVDGDVVRIAHCKKRRDALRDATRHPAIDAAKTPEELRKTVPEVLAGLDK